MEDDSAEVTLTVILYSARLTTSTMCYLTMMSAGSAETDDFSGKFGRRPQANLGEERQ